MKIESEIEDEYISDEFENSSPRRSEMPASLKDKNSPVAAQEFKLKQQPVQAAAAAIAVSPQNAVPR